MSLLISDVMTKKIRKIGRLDLAEEARKRILENDNKSLLVVENEKLVGIISRSDIIKGYDSETKVENLMSTDVLVLNKNHTVQDAAKIFTENSISSLPVIDKNENVVGIITTQDIVKDVANVEENDDVMSLEVMTIHLAMTKNRELEEYWIQKAYEHGYKAVITQVGANAEKLAVKMRESAIVSAIAKGVIKEASREKIAVSNAVRDVYAQLNLTNPGLGGGFKIAIAIGNGMITVAAFGRCGHALANGPEQIVLGYSIV